MKPLRIPLFLLVCVFTSASFAQIIEEPEEIRYPKSEFTVGLNINTVGALPGGLNLRYSRHLFGMHYSSFQLDIFNIKHPKEVIYTADSTRSPWIPYKLNYLYSIRPMFGWEFLFFRKEREEGIQLRWIVATGPSFGILKPNMVVYGTTQNRSQSVPYGSLPGSYNPSLIYGDRPFEGFDRSKLIMGFNFKTSLMLEFGAVPKSVTGIEVGFQFETFSTVIELMDTKANSSTFTSAFLTLFFGSRRY
ncbi:MAG: hypothetical protein K2Q22_16510 [Cytophagales bacterium]|nr:hypothetical protein [Cytophagales bacterium]